MNTTPQLKEAWRWLHRSASAMLLLGLLTAQQAIANAPPAGTSISNKASVTYLDNTLNRQSVDSNDVVTIVQQVGAFDFSNAGNTRQGGAGSTVYVQHSVTNTGNGADTFRIKVDDTANPAGTFSNIQVFRDNGSGLPQGNALCTLTATGNTPACSAGATTVIDSGNTFNFVVAYSIPGNAGTSWTGGNNQALVTVEPVNNNATLFATYSPPSRTATDTIEFTTGAIFTLTQAFVAPGQGIDPNSSGNSLTPWPVVSSGLRSTQTTVTLTYQNTGDSAGSVYIKNQIPTGFDYVEDSAVLSCASGVGLKSDGSNSQALCNNANIEFSVDSNGLMSVVVPNAAVGSQATLSYQVKVSSTAAFGIADTTSRVEFATCSSNTIANCSGTTPLTQSNELRFNVLAAQSVDFNVADATSRDANDNKTTNNIVPGRPAFQTHTITNSGDAADTFNISIAAGNFPAGTEFVWFNENAGQLTSALSDTNADGIVDTGSIAAGVSKNLILRITIPQGTTSATSVNYEATATATSVRVFNNTPVSDTTLVRVTNVIAGLVDLSVTNPNPNQPGPDLELGPLPAGGSLIEVPITITNNDSDNTFKIESSTNPNQFPGNLPDGWTVDYSTNPCSSNPRNMVADPNNVSVTSGSTETVYACISTPTDAPADETSVYFKVTANQDASDGSRPTDTIEVSIDLLAAGDYSMSLSAGSNQTVTPGSFVDFNFTLANTGSFACGTQDRLRVQAQLPANRVTEGWTVSVFRKGFNKDGSSSAPNNTNVDLANDDTLLDAAGGLAVNDSKDFIVRVFAPSGANQGLSVTVNITVSDVDAQRVLQTSPNGCGVQRSSGTLNTISSLLGVTKTHYVDDNCGAFNAANLVGTTLNAKPGDCIYYRVQVVNNGSSNVTNVAITDRAPTGTTLRTGAGQTPRCVSTGLTVLNSGSLSRSNSGQEVSCSSGSNGNTLAPSGTITFDFEVRVND